MKNNLKIRKPKFDRSKLKKYKNKLIKHINQELNINPSKLDNIFVRWIFIANMKKKLDKDLIPKDNIIIDEDIKYLTSKNKHALNFNKKIRCFENELKNIIVKKDKKYYYFIKENIEYKITNIQYKRLLHIYISNNFNEDVFLLLDTYNTLGGLTNLLSFPLNIFDDNEYIELFGSPLNTQNKYCSAFEFEKKYFSSLGSFFDYELKEGKYISNPPFDEIIMEKMVDKLILNLNNVNNLAIIIILPVWDPESQILLNTKNYKKNFKAYNKLKKCEFLKEKQILKKHDYKFYDYFKDKYIPVSHTHIILLSNYKDNIKIDDIKEKWEYQQNYYAKKICN